PVAARFRRGVGRWAPCPQEIEVSWDLFRGSERVACVTRLEPRGGRFLDLEAWPRAATFRFFRGHEQPFFNVCAPVDVARTLALCRASGRSFSLAAWFLCLRAAEAVEPL